ncbi:MAG: aminotransferase class I/II-fold pyridoxal phosphate-dependent enzyme [Lachnospiraceae bacterium]|nr:aminotransferase class I/II-fold pyridoxal phosphate-dependent enzyme [Lachnospiraceae bacterium]
MKFSDRLDRFEDEIFASLDTRRLALEKAGKTIYNLSIGTPDFPVFDHLKEALKEAADDPDNWKYALHDSDEMLEAVCSYYKKRFGVTITPDMVVSCRGSQDGIGHLGMVLCNEGDTVLLPTPCYPVFIAGARMAGAEPWYYPMSEEKGFLPDLEAIPDEVADRAKYMIFSLPSNPMGSIGGPEVYEDVIAFARKHDILLIHDNAYSDIIFGNAKGKSFFNYEGAAEQGVEFFSLSKSFNLTGARISFLIGRPDVVAAYRKLVAQIDFGMFRPLQKVAVAALTGPLDLVEEQCRKYEARSKALCGGLRAIGWDVPDSQGSMFVWAKLPAHYSDSMQFAQDLMEKAGVVCTPGESFGPMGKGYVRFALVLPPEKMALVAEAIRESGILNEK